MTIKTSAHILLYSIFYHPEKIGVSVFNHDLAGYLSERGYRVSVVTAFPWYPRWKVEPPYNGRFWMKERQGRVTVRRAFVPSLKKISAKTRIWHECVFVFFSLRHMVSLFFKDVDAVIAVCPPLQLGLAAKIFCFFKRVPLIFHVQDLQVDAAVETGLLKKGALLSAVGRLERFIFQAADVVTTISEGMRRRIIRKGISRRKVLLFPNWVDTEKIFPMPRDNEFRRSLGIRRDVFLVLYAGNIGAKQGVEILTEVAQRTVQERDIFYLVVGEGAGSRSLREKMQLLGLDNMRLMKLQPKEKLSLMLSSADISLIIQKKSVGDSLMPSKLLNIMASGRPVVACAGPSCELAKVIEKTGCGRVVAPEDPQALAQAVLHFYRQPAMCRECGGRGRIYAQRFLSREKILADFDRLMRKMMMKVAPEFDGRVREGMNSF